MNLVIITERESAESLKLLVITESCSCSIQWISWITEHFNHVYDSLPSHSANQLSHWIFHSESNQSSSSSFKQELGIISLFEYIMCLAGCDKILNINTQRINQIKSSERSVISCTSDTWMNQWTNLNQSFNWTDSNDSNQWKDVWFLVSESTWIRQWSRFF